MAERLERWAFSNSDSPHPLPPPPSSRGGTKYELLKNACVGGYIRTSSNKRSVEFYDLLKTDMVLIPLTTLSQKV